MVIDDDTEGYVAYYDVQDEDDDALPRFFAVWTTKKLMEIFHQDDATHLFMWHILTLQSCLSSFCQWLICYRDQL